MNLPRSLFRLDEATHGEACAGCRKASRDAALYSSVTGSTGATYVDDRTRLDPPEFHRAVVSRVWRTR